MFICRFDPQNLERRLGGYSIKQVDLQSQRQPEQNDHFLHGADDAGTNTAAGCIFFFKSFSNKNPVHAWTDAGRIWWSYLRPDQGQSRRSLLSPTESHASAGSPVSLPATPPPAPPPPPWRRRNKDMKLVSRFASFTPRSSLESADFFK